MDAEKLLTQNEPWTSSEANFICSLSKKQLVKIMDKISGKVKYYHYLITFTKDPQKCKNVTNEFLESYIEKQMKRAPLQITQCYLVREGDDVDVHVHWHCAVQTLKCLKKDRFHYYVKKYGNIDISISKVQNLEESINYLSKDSTPVVVV